MSRAKKYTFDKILNFILALMLILNCQSVYQNNVDVNFYVFELTFVTIIVSGFWQLIRWGIPKKKLGIFVSFAAIYYAYLLLVVVLSVDQDNLISFVSRYIVVPFVMLYFISSSPYELKIDLFKKFINIMVVISIVSIFFWLFGTLLHLIPTTGVTNFMWGHVYTVPNYYNIYFEVQYVDWIGTIMKRNTAIFVEGPMFSLVLIFALLFTYVFGNDFKISKWKTAVLILAMLTTFSVTGILLVFAIAYVFILKSKKWRLLVSALIIPAVIAAVIFLFAKKSSTGSYSLRIEDYIIGFKAWMQSPLYGGGYGNLDNIVRDVTKRSNVGFSNSFFAILAQGGILYLLMYILPIFKSLKIALTNKKVLVITICYLYCMFTVIFYTMYINFYIWMMLSISLFYKRKRSLELSSLGLN